MARESFQEKLPENYCWGCGSANPHGLKIRSFWDGEEAVATWQPQEFHAAGPRHILNGGIIASLIDCHAVCTAIAAAYRAEDRPVGSSPPLWYATGTLKVTYLKPTPLGGPVLLRARVMERKEKKTTVACSLFAEGVECARAEVVAVRVSDAWRRP
jgi:acyl-coenzyme A thioesterase PaaI-like protein